MTREKDIKINFEEIGKLFLSALVIFILKYILTTFAGVKFRINETTSMGMVLIGLVLVAMILEYWKGFHIIGKGDGKGMSIIAGIGVGIFASSVPSFIATVVVTCIAFGFIEHFLAAKREKERLEKEARKPKHTGKKKKSKKKR